MQHAKKGGISVGGLYYFEGADFKNDLHFLHARQGFALRGVKVAKSGILSYLHDFFSQKISKNYETLLNRFYFFNNQHIHLTLFSMVLSSIL